MYLARPHFFWFRMKSFLMPFWLQGVFFFFLFLLPCICGKTRPADQLQHVHENEKKNKPVSMLIICYIKGISRSASCWNLRYHTRGMLPVSTLAPSHCPNCWYIRWKEGKKMSRTDLVIHTHKPSPIFISLCVALHYWIPQQTKRQTSLRCFLFFHCYDLLCYIKQ